MGRGVKHSTHLTLADLERQLKWLVAARANEVMEKGEANVWSEYLYVETGRYKPYTLSTVRAAMRRGYRVEAHCRNTVFYVWPKEHEHLVAAKEVAHV